MENRTSRLTVMFTPKERAAIEENAKKMGMTLSVYVRYILTQR